MKYKKFIKKSPSFIKKKKKIWRFCNIFFKNKFVLKKKKNV